MSPSDIRNILCLFNQGISQKEIAGKLGTTITIISDIVRKKIYKEVEREDGVYIPHTKNQGKNNKLSAENVKDILLRLLKGERANKLAKEYGVSPTTIGLIKNKKTWRHLLGGTS